MISLQGKQVLLSFLIGVIVGALSTSLIFQVTQTTSSESTSDFTTQGVQGGGSKRKDIEVTFGLGLPKTLGEIHTNQYLLINICDSRIGQCKIGAEKNNDLFEKRANEGNCQLLTVTSDGDLPAWIAKIGAAPFVQKRSAEVVGGLYKLMNAFSIPPGMGKPYYALIDSNGQIVVDQSGWGDLDTKFAPYCGQPKQEGYYCDIDEDSYLSKEAISSDPKDVPHVKKEQVGTETKYIYCDAQSCKYVSCNETAPGNDCNDMDKGITIPGTICTSPEGYPGVLDDACICQTNLWFCDGDLDGHKSKTPYSTDPTVIPHIKETQVGTETKFILCDANECHYVDCLHTPGDDCDDTDKNKVDCAGTDTACYKKVCDFDNNGVLDTTDEQTLRDRILGKVRALPPLCDLDGGGAETMKDVILLQMLIKDCAGKHPDTCKNTTPVKGWCGSPDGKHVNYPGSPDYDPIHACTANNCPYCDGNACFPAGGTCYYYCEDSKGNQNYTTSCGQGDAKNIVQPGTCPALMQDNFAGCGTYCSEDAGGTNGGTNGDPGNAGQCGIAHGKSFSDANEVNAAGLCAQGVAVPSAVSGPAPWHRSCRGNLESSLCEATQTAGGVIGGNVEATVQRDEQNMQ